MDIDLSLLHSKQKEYIDITNNYNIPTSYYKNTDIINLDNVKVDGYVRCNEEEKDVIECKIEGTMIIKDSITLEDVEYKYEIDYNDIVEENCKKGENILDILEFLWENILLEVPLQFTKVKDLSKFHGDGWKLISEDELNKTNNPFSDLLKDYEKE